MYPEQCVARVISSTGAKGSISVKKASLEGVPAPANHHITQIAQMADIGFKVVLLERLNQKWKQKHF